MQEPTNEHIADALKRARELVERNGFDLIRSLAEATTTAQCEGVLGFQVFRDIRTAVQDVLPKGETLKSYSDKASKQETITILDQARMVVAS